MQIVKSTEPRLRDIGFESLILVRIETGRPVLPRSVAHKLFMRELGEFRRFNDPAVALESTVGTEARLLADTFRESADSALQRAISALVCWYEPKPLWGAFQRLRTRDASAAASALEYLGHVLPRSMFRHLSGIFEPQAARAPEVAVPVGQPLEESIRVAWKSDDGWLRACAVRASREAPGFDRSLFATGEGDSPLVRAELAALGGEGA
jgi:hypothetical protein